MHPVKRVVLALGALTVSVALATDYEWANTSDRAANWDDVANWRAGGESAASQPLTADDTATIPSTTAFLQTISWDAGVWSSGNARTLGTLNGGDEAQLGFGSRDGEITIANPNGFAGVFRMDQARGILQSTSSSDFTPTFKAVNARNWTKINNFGTEGKVVVGSAFGEGRVSVNAGYNGNDEKMVASVVEVGETGGFPQEVKVNNGTAIFRGRSKQLALAVAEEAWMHLDASVTGSIETDENGKITKWNDVRGNGVFAGPYQPTWAKTAFNRPTLIANWANGLPAVDFGLYSGTKAAAEAGSAYAGAEWFSNNGRVGNPSALAWSERRTDIKEVVFVFADTSATNYPAGVKVCSPYVIGDGEQDSFARGDTGKLFANNTAFDMRSTLNGEVRVNGHRVSYDHAENYAYCPFVVSVRGAGDLAGAAFGASGRVCRNDENRDLHLGGIRLGEVLVYTRALTDAERASLEQYLMAKWCPAATVELAREDVALLDMSKQGSQVSFEDGTFTVGEMRLPKGMASYTKTGSGALEVGKLPATCRSIAVEEGGFALRQRLHPAPDATKGPAAEPQVWLDATKADSFEYDGANIVRWNDWRTNLPGKRSWTSSYFDEPVTYPTRNTDNPDRPYVDFGAYATQSGSGSQKFNDYDGRTLEAFVVYRNHAGMDSVYPFAGGGIIAGTGTRWDGKKPIQATWYSSADMLSATIRQNGVPTEDESAYVQADSLQQFAVYSLRLPAGCDMNILGSDRGGYGSLGGGGCDFAEVLYYDRRLTDAERGNTEAYLMKKWLGKEHPDTVRLTSLASVSFAPGVEPALGSDEPLSVGSVSGTGDFVKTGLGDVNIGKVSGFESLVVEGGSLTAEEDMMGDAYFHVDASASDSLVFAEGDESGLIARWNDVRGNGRYAEALVKDIGNGEQNLKYPLLKTDSVPGLAEGMPYVDFRQEARPANYATIPCSSMRWVDENGSTDGSTKIREVHVVYCEDHDGIDAGHEIGSFIGTSNWFSGQRGISYQFLRAGLDWYHIFAYSDCTAKAWMRMDGVNLLKDSNGIGDYYSCATPANRHLHVLSISSTDYDLEANAFCNDRGNCGAGGYKLCEVVIFTGNTNSTEKFEAINDYLCKKWRDIGEGGSYTALKSLRATGGTLKLSSATDAVAPKDGANLAFAFKDADDCGKIEVTGDFVVPENGTISVTLPQKGEPKPTPGEYVLFQADRFVNAENFANWTVTAETNGRFEANVRIDAESGKIILTVSKIGYTVILK